MHRAIVFLELQLLWDAAELEFWNAIVKCHKCYDDDDDDDDDDDNDVDDEDDDDDSISQFVFPVHVTSNNFETSLL